MNVNEFLALKKKMEALNHAPIPNKLMQETVNNLRATGSALAYTGKIYLEVWHMEDGGYDLFISSPQQYNDKLESLRTKKALEQKITENKALDEIKRLASYKGTKPTPYVWGDDYMSSFKEPTPTWTSDPTEVLKKLILEAETRLKVEKGKGMLSGADWDDEGSFKGKR